MHWSLVLWRTLKIPLSRDLARSLIDMLSRPEKVIINFSCSLVASLTTLLYTVAQAVSLPFDCQFLGKMLNSPH